MVEHKKPDPGVYLTALGLLKLCPAECVAFEDSESGVRAARDAGLHVIAVPSELSQNHDFSNAHLVIDSLVQVNEELFGSLV